MAVIGSSFLNLLDFHKADVGNAATLELLMQRNSILNDMIAVEANQGSTHNYSIRTGYGSAFWGKLYQGVAPSKGSRQAVSETTGFIEAGSSVDERLLEVGDPAKVNALRLSEASGTFEVFRQAIASAIFYSNSAVNPEQPMGLAPRFNAYATGSFNQGTENQVIHAGGVGSDNTSAWFVTWSEDTCFALYPKGTTAGVKRIDRGRQKAFDANGLPYFAMEETFRQHFGLGVKDYRGVARVANIDVSELEAGTLNIHSKLLDAYYKLDHVLVDESDNKRNYMGQTYLYVNKTMALALDKLEAGFGAAANSKLQLRVTEQQGKRVMTFRDVPIRICDAILNTESLVPAAS